MIDQLINEDYSIYNADCMDIIKQLPDESIDLSVYSPPFAGLYNYSSSEKDFSNCESKEQFLQQYEFLISEISRVTKAGRITAVHLTNIKDSKTGNMWNLPSEVIKIHNKYGFDWKDQITVWKEPLKVRMRTMVRSLMHKLIVEDSTECFTAMPDYIIVFKKRGVNKVPVTHEFGLFDYFGETPILPNILNAWNNQNGTKFTESELWLHLNKKYESWDNPKTNKLSHYIWQRYASSVWDDIRINNVLKYKNTKDEDDEKHVHPLQLDVIDRCVTLWSNPGEVVFTPFMGVGSEVYSPVSLGRKAIGVELKRSYYKQAVLNLKDIKSRFAKQETLF